MPRIIGITGTIGSGKSTVGKILTELGIPVVDTDDIVHELMQQDRGLKNTIVERFGESVLKADDGSTIDRARLGRIVFQDEKARRDLESMVHPLVLLEYRRRAASMTGNAVVAILVPLLFEAGIASEFDEVWTVVADNETLRRRLKDRDRLSDAEVDSRLSAQLPQAEKASRADRTIDNSGSLADTRRQLEIHLDIARGSC